MDRASKKFDLKAPAYDRILRDGRTVAADVLRAVNALTQQDIAAAWDILERNRPSPSLDGLRETLPQALVLAELERARRHIAAIASAARELALSDY